MALIKKILPFAITLLVVVYLFLVDNPSSRLFEQDNSKGLQEAPVLFMTNFVNQHYDKHGRLKQILKGERAEHFQPTAKASDKDFTLIQHISAEIYNDDIAPWHISADLGRATQKGEKIELTGNVHFWQVDPEQGKTELFTEKMIYFTKRQYAETEQPVKIITPTGVVTAVGLSADIKAQQLTLKNRVRGTHEPH